MQQPTVEKEYTIADLTRQIGNYLRYVRKKFWVLILAGIIGISLGLVYYFLIQKPKFTGAASFVLQEKSSSSLGSFAGLASQLGLDISGAGSGNSLFAGENILEILTSQHIIYKALLTNVNGDTGNGPKLIDRFLEVNKMKERWADKKALAGINYFNVSSADSLTPLQDSVMQIVYKGVTKSLSVEKSGKKTTIVLVGFTSTDTMFARRMPQLVISEAAIFYINVKTTLIRKNVEKLERRADSLLLVLNGRSYNAADLRILDANPAMRTIRVPEEIAVRDRAVAGTLYGEVVKNLEIARMTLVQETPLIQILDVPGKSLTNFKRGKLVCMAAGIFVFGMLGAMFLFFRWLKVRARQ
jgi:uncharacterized protein involved in exopolysaccharide biosynthesis